MIKYMHEVHLRALRHPPIKKDALTLTLTGWNTRERSLRTLGLLCSTQRASQIRQMHHQHKMRSYLIHSALPYLWDCRLPPLTVKFNCYGKKSKQFETRARQSRAMLATTPRPHVILAHQYCFINLLTDNFISAPSH